MKVFVSSTVEDLKAYRAAAKEVILKLKHQPEMMEYGTPGYRPTVEQCTSMVADSDIMILIVAFRRGWCPRPDQGGDGIKSITEIEYEIAKSKGTPVLVFRADRSWPGDLWETDDAARKAVESFRNSIDQFVEKFYFESEAKNDELSLPAFRGLLGIALTKYFTESKGGASVVDPLPDFTRYRLRSCQRVVDLPSRPYPLLDAYEHPALFCGRDREIELVLNMLNGSSSIVGVFAASGVGKSSLLKAGIVPRLVDEGNPVALCTRPHEPNIVRGILGQIFEPVELPEVDSIRPETFSALIRHSRDSAGKTPVLILDQFERVISQQSRLAAAIIGPLIASTCALESISSGSTCRWLLSYRQECHGALVAWLYDVLQDANRLGRPGTESLPSDLSDPERFRGLSLPPFGSGSSEEDVGAFAASCFFNAITRPLQMEGGGKTSQWNYRIEKADALALAQAFAAARVLQPGAPLVPELQVVLGHMLANSDRSKEDEGRLIVPSNAEEVISNALKQHIVRSLMETFPDAANEPSQQKRTLAWRALKELALLKSGNVRGMPESELLQYLGGTDVDVIYRLTRPDVRLLVGYSSPRGTFYELSHDRLASLIRDIPDDEILRQGGLVDEQIMELTSFVERRVELYSKYGDEAASDLSNKEFLRIQEHETAIVGSGNEERSRWWVACTKARSSRRKTRIRRLLAIAASVAVVLVLSTTWFANYVAEADAISEVRSGEPGKALLSLHRLRTDFDYSGDDLVRLLGEMDTTTRDNIFGLGYIRPNLPDSDILVSRAALVIPLVEIIREPAKSLLSPHSLYGAMLSALDFGADPKIFGDSTGYWELRDSVVESLRSMVGSDYHLATDSSYWSPSIAAGPYLIGCLDTAKYIEMFVDDPIPDEGSRTVWISTDYQVGRREVSLQEFRQFIPGHLTRDERRRPNDPVIEVSWYQAYAYAAWMGAGLPKESEWEVAARAGSESMWWFGDEIGYVDSVTWTCSNGSGRPMPVDSTPSITGPTHPYHLKHILGNVQEWTEDWYTEGDWYQDSSLTSPQYTNGRVFPDSPVSDFWKEVRGGCYDKAVRYSRSAQRLNYRTSDTRFYVGLRLVRRIGDSRHSNQRGVFSSIHVEGAHAD